MLASDTLWPAWVHGKRLIDFFTFTWPKCNRIPSINSKFLLLWPLYSVNIIAHSAQCENSETRKLVPPATVSERQIDRQADGRTYGRKNSTNRETNHIPYEWRKENARTRRLFDVHLFGAFQFYVRMHTLRNIFWLILNFSVRRSTNDEKWHFEWILIDTNLFINDVIQSIRAKWKHHQSRTHTNTLKKKTINNKSTERRWSLFIFSLFSR